MKNNKYKVQKVKFFTLRDLPKDERPRERLIKFGAEALSIQELLQIILRSGRSGESVAVLSQKLLSHFGNLKNLLEASLEELMSIKGIGLAKATQIKAVLELAKRYNLQIEEKTKSKKILSPEDVFKLIRSKLKDYNKEHFYIIALNARNYIISEISIGTLNTSLVHPREVFAEVIRQRANSIILVHNHPSGDPEPSKDDIEITKRLQEAGKLLGIEILDHIIITKNSYFSFKNKGILK
ncbi:MAG: DNA repair protein RadC [Candidatus Micrarchaeia archaeon]